MLKAAFYCGDNLMFAARPYPSSLCKGCGLRDKMTYLVYHGNTALDHTVLQKVSHKLQVSSLHCYHQWSPPLLNWQKKMLLKSSNSGSTNTHTHRYYVQISERVHMGVGEIREAYTTDAQ